MKKVAALAAALALLAACSGAGKEVSPSLFLPFDTTTTAAPPTTAPPATPNCTAGINGTVVQSTQPTSPLPSPGNMPAGSYMRTIQDRGKLIVGTSPDQLLFGYVNPAHDNTVEGLDADVLRYVAAAIFGGSPADPTVGGHIQIDTITLAQRIPDIQSGDLDLVADTMTINCARRLQVDFSSVYYDAGQKILVARGSGITDVHQLAGKKVCTAEGSTSLQNLQAIKGVIPVGVADQSDCLVQFQEGQVDAISTDDTVLAGLAIQDPYAEVVGSRFTDEPYGMAISLKHPEFTAFVNGVLAQMRSDGALSGLYQKWLGSVVSPLPAVPAAAYRP